MVLGRTNLPLPAVRPVLIKKFLPIEKTVTLTWLGSLLILFDKPCVLFKN